VKRTCTWTEVASIVQISFSRHLRLSRSSGAVAWHEAAGKLVRSYPQTWLGRYSTHSGDGFFALGEDAGGYGKTLP
jgi:hypothetical protein